jgi:hypothetical protein
MNIEHNNTRPANILHCCSHILVPSHLAHYRVFSARIPLHGPQRYHQFMCDMQQKSHDVSGHNFAVFTVTTFNMTLKFRFYKAYDYLG